MSDKDTGGPAFPIGSGDMRDPTGMTLRDYFAAKAMQAVIINSDRGSTHIEEVVLWVGRYSYDVADAMLQERLEERLEEWGE